MTRTIETRVTVDEQGLATLQFPPDGPPGEHKVVVVIEEVSTGRPNLSVKDLPKHNIPWPFAPTETFRREDMYGDDGR